MSELRFLAPTGMLGGGFREDYFRAAAATGIDFIACDSGSIDGGPANLGGNLPIFSHDAMKRDLRLLLLQARALDIPLLIGSSGGSGGRANLQWTWDIVAEIAAEADLHFKAALIDSEQDPAFLQRKYREGRITPLQSAPAIDESTFERAEHIVAMMGTAPYIEALRGGADVVLAGRSSDAALFAAIPTSRGMPAGLAWHAAKIVECGGSAVIQVDNTDGMLCTITDDYFELTPTNPDHRCTPVSVASHALYETSNPFTMYEPGGVMHLDRARFDAVDDRTVRVSGGEFEPAPYTVKLEGAELAGYRTMFLGGISDPAILDRLDDWLADAKAATVHAISRVVDQASAEACELFFRVYGRDAVIPGGGPVVAPEVGLLVTALAPTQELAHTAAAQAGFTMLHFRVPEWHGLVSNLAFPFSPHLIDLGPAYRFTLHHVLELDDPLEIFPITYREV